MQNFWLIAQGFLSVVIVALILLQSQGSGLGAAFGGGGENYHTRRGVEKMIFYLTIIGVVLFTLISIMALV